MRINTGEHEWVDAKKASLPGYYLLVFGYNDHDVAAEAVVTLDELRQIVAAIEKMEASDE